jgi:fatty-acyl-CoA synthase
MANVLGELVEPGTRVAIIGKNSFDFLALAFAASRCGAMPEPVSYRLAPPEWRFIIEAAGAQVVLKQDLRAPYWKDAGRSGN